MMRTVEQEVGASEDELLVLLTQCGMYGTIVSTLVYRTYDRVS